MFLLYSGGKVKKKLEEKIIFLVHITVLISFLLMKTKKLVGVELIPSKFKYIK